MAAATAESTASQGSVPRINVLAKSKEAPLFVPHRRSVYWPEREPYKTGPKGTTAFVVNEWQDKLAQPKKNGPTWDFHHRLDYFATHLSHFPIWPVSNAAKNAKATPRLEQLAEAKPFHSLHTFDKPVLTEIPSNAMKAKCTPRLEAISVQKDHLVWPGDNNMTLTEGEFDESITKVSQNAKKGQATERISTLSEHKVPPKSYRPERTVMWPVTNNAKNAVATTRLQQLSRPKSCRLNQYDFDNWWKVAPGALNAHCTNRLSELSEPIPRKVRQKIAAKA